jgi:hypothetical protein
MPGRIFELNSKETDEHSPKKKFNSCDSAKTFENPFFLQ